MILGKVLANRACDRGTEHVRGQNGPPRGVGTKEEIQVERVVPDAEDAVALVLGSAGDGHEPRGFAVGGLYVYVYV